MENTPFVRELASSDRRTRDKALESLTLFLRSRTDLSLVELLKLWKGLFFCFYHADRPLTQQALARALSYSLVPTMSRSALNRFLRAFWITIGRDFHSLDRLRLDKYLYLIRCYVGVAFKVFLKKQQHDVPVSMNEAVDGSSGNANGKKRKHEPIQSSDESNNKKQQKLVNQKDQQGTGQQQNGISSSYKVAGKAQSNQQHDEYDEQNGNNMSQQDREVDSKWAELSAYLGMLEEGPLCPVNFNPSQPSTRTVKGDESDDAIAMPHGPDGLRYHILDIWLDELEKVLEFEDGEETIIDNNGSANGSQTSTIRKPKGDVPMHLILRPMERLSKESPYRPVRTRAMEVLNDQRLIKWGFKEPKKEDGDEVSDEEWGGFD